MADSSGQIQTEYDLESAKEKYRKSKGQRERFVPDWCLNLAFYVGQQWLYWNQGRLDMPQIADWRELVTDNRIQPTVTGRVAKKVKDRPQFVATPSTADESDIDASKIAEKVLDADWIGLNLQQKLFLTELFADICGAGFWKIYWDSSKGEQGEFVYGPDGAVTQENGSPLKADLANQAFGGALPDGYSTQTVGAGDVCVDVLSPFEIFPDPLATTLEECEWVIEEKVRSPEYIKRRYGVDLPPDTDAPVGPIESRLYSSAVYSGGGTSGTYQGVKLYECWERPSTNYPQGLRCVWAADQVLELDDQPFDPMPYAMFSGVAVPNRFWPTSVVTQLRGPQVHLNKVRSQIAMNAARIGNPSLLTSRQANITFEGNPGERIYYDSTVPDAVPSYLQPPEVPTYVREEIDRIIDSITEISGMHEVSNATVPAGVTAASAINLLQEADDTRAGPEIQDMEKQLGSAGTKILKLRAQYNSDERLIRIAGEDGNWDIFSFRGEMLRGNTEVEVQAGSAMPRSKAAKQAAMLEVLQIAFQYGMQFDPRDLRRFFKDYDVGALDRLFDTITTDEVQCQREQRLMSQGIAVNINDYDDDSYHVDAHEDFQKSDLYQKLGPNVQQLVQLHVDAHKQRQVDATNLQVQAQQAQMNGYPQAPAAQISTPEGGLANVANP